jgi:hypothetical protein
MAISRTVRDKIAAQIKTEIQFSRLYKQGKIRNWQKNEQMYYGYKLPVSDSRANVELGLMQSYVHSLLSKIDNPLHFKFVKRKESQLKRAARLNALRQSDSQAGFWDLKDIAGKKQAVIYGRAIYAYYADSYDGYCSHLEPVDVYDFLVDPAGGGLDLENARYMGRYGVVKDKRELKEGMKRGDYIRAVVERLIDGSGNSEEMSQEEINKRSRAVDTNITKTSKEVGDPDKFKFWEWYTTFEGERYYALYQDTSGAIIRLEKLEDLFTPTKEFPLAAWPFWSYAAFVDLTEFWTPSFCDYTRELFMAQASAVNQTLDNGEAINKPMKYIDTGAIKNLAELKYRRDGHVKLKAGTDATKAVQIAQTPQIDTPLKLFELLDGVVDKNSGVTNADKGVASEDRVAIYEGNQANAADRFGLLNKSYSFGYRRFAQLYQIGVSDNLTKKVAIDIIGPDGIETEEISRRDIFRKSEYFNILVEASSAEEQSDANDAKNKLTFLVNTGANPTAAAVVNWEKAFEVGAKVAGFTEDEIKQLLDKSEYGNAEIISEASKDIEDLLDGKDVKPNYAANLAYKQKFVDYMMDHENDMTHEQFMKLAQYIQSLEPVIMKNVVREMNAKMLAMNLSTSQPNPTSTPPAPDGGGNGDLSLSPSSGANGSATAPAGVPSGTAQ